MRLPSAHERQVVALFGVGPPPLAKLEHGERCATRLALSTNPLQADGLELLSHIGLEHLAGCRARHDGVIKRYGDVMGAGDGWTFLKQRGFTKMTVTDICKEAQINRGTF